MTTPAIVPTGYAGTAADYLRVKADRSGAARMVRGTVSVPALTATDTIIGLVPFQKGAAFHLCGNSIHVADLDSSTNVTLDVGMVFESGTGDDLDAWVSASTAPQAGGFVTVDEKEGLAIVAAENGWLVAQVNAATTTTGLITFNVRVAYDS